ncbi:PTS sugar transporter subunit IIA [Desulfoluna butyratoxydans]|uniref:Phosphotransferase/anion transporter n=1 Tax=Desulfoluna butyratoxydans TaxID=231438 RepID=A0A4U8YKX3_9BACT|nr:PTS sugar transporter subunit IIA [Desulfoluna butyratoxydans]VFQ44311.1 phosphotransferase/anion transporter [Desulfoluna butyratoxydans]
MKLRLDELAEAMDLPRDTLERWIRQGSIPVKKSGAECSFSFATLKSWAGKHNTTFVLKEPSSPSGDTREAVTLSDALERGGVVFGLDGDDVPSVLRNMTASVRGFGEGERDALFHLLDERERLASTGVGRGVALPHPRTPMDACRVPSITTFFLKHPVDFEAVDDLPVRVLFLILSPDVGTHLQLLSKISFCVREPAFLRFLESVPSEAALLEKVAEFETRL